MDERNLVDYSTILCTCGKKYISTENKSYVR